MTAEELKQTEFYVISDKGIKRMVNLGELTVQVKAFRDKLEDYIQLVSELEAENADLRKRIEISERKK